MVLDHPLPREVHTAWCGFIGTPGCSAGSDGLVPVASQRLPGAPAGASISIPDVAHLQQPSDGRTFDALSSLYRAQLGIPLRNTQPALSVSAISGPLTVQAAETSAYSASASGGALPYQFQWRVNGALQQSGPGNTFSYTNGGTDFFVQLMVLDALGSTVTRYASVHVASCGGGESQN